MTDPGELPLPEDLTLSEAGLRLIADDSGTSLEFVCQDSRTLRLRINDLSEWVNRHDAQILRNWSAEQQARRKL